MAIYVDNTVRGFSRYNKYGIGTDMRDLSRMVIRLIIKANSEVDKISTLTVLRACPWLEQGIQSRNSGLSLGLARR
ncbi:MAG: hypothetical protein HQL61_16160 [Magnetococcales bacterium]|nr:hypothetical protein [Nitrospirota bacterium]